jgi:hypothetical protein
MGLRIRAEREEGDYETGVRVSAKDLATPPFTRNDFHGDLNCSLTPATAQSNMR